MTERTRIVLEEQIGARKPLDAGWSKRKKLIVGVAAGSVAVAALAAGAIVHMTTRPPSLPKSATEAVAVLTSEKFDLLDEGRKRQYTAEAGRLMRDMSEEERRALFAEESNREALRILREERFDELARRFARGEAPTFNPEQFRNRRDGDGPPAFVRENMPRDREGFMEQIRSQIADTAHTKGAHEKALQTEMAKRRSQSGAGGAGGAGGGGRGGGRGG